MFKKGESILEQRRGASQWNILKTIFCSLCLRGAETFVVVQSFFRGLKSPVITVFNPGFSQTIVAA